MSSARNTASVYLDTIARDRVDQSTAALPGFVRPGQKAQSSKYTSKGGKQSLQQCYEDERCECEPAVLIPGTQATGLAMVCPVRKCGTVIDPTTIGTVVVRCAPVDCGFYLGLPSIPDMEPLEPCVRECDSELQQCQEIEAQQCRQRESQQCRQQETECEEECALLQDLTATIGNRVVVRNLARSMIRVKSADNKFNGRHCVDHFVQPYSTVTFVFTPIGWVYYDH